MRARVGLRAWRVEDAAALRRAWAVPDVAAWSRVPAEPTEEAARRWIAGAEVRAAAGLSLDWVIGPPSPGAGRGSGEAAGEPGADGGPGPGEGSDLRPPPPAPVGAGPDPRLASGPEAAAGEVWGEVGVARLLLAPASGATPGDGGGQRVGGLGARGRPVWEMGWWLFPEHRGRGRATAGVGSALARLAAARAPGWPDLVIARIAPGNAASARVAERAGFRPRGAGADGRVLWSCPLPGTAAAPPHR